MQQFIYRAIQEKDYKAIENLLDTTGYFKKFTPNNKIRKIVLEVYLRSCLEDSTFTKVAEYKGKVIGIICGRNDKQYLKATWTPYTAGILRRLFYLRLLKEGRQTLKAHRDFSQNYKKLMGDKEKQFDGELTLLIVDEAYRGKGIGKILIKQFLEDMEKRKARKVYLFTDTMCNYAFYDNRGFRRMGERKVVLGKNESHKDSVKEKVIVEIYLYEKRIGAFKEKRTRVYN